MNSNNYLFCPLFQRFPGVNDVLATCMHFSPFKQVVFINQATFRLPLITTAKYNIFMLITSLVFSLLSTFLFMVTSFLLQKQSRNQSY